MSRYVNANYVKAVMLNDRLLQGNAEFALYVQQVDIYVKALPGIDIVRCRECKHWTNGDDTYGICYRCPNTRQMQADDFCSYGSRSKKPNNSTISKMEQVDKDINVRSTDEPQTCSFSDCDNFKNPDYERCIECKRKQIKLKTEQTERKDQCSKLGKK